MKALKLSIYYLSKFVGLFALTKFLTRKKLRILCYHGISLAEEHLFFDQLFITLELFKQRMNYLYKKQIPVIPLSEAIESLKNGTLKNNSTVITFDDGWLGVYGETSDFLERLNFPWTLYVTTYYMQKQTQVFNIVFQYMLTLTRIKKIEFQEDRTFINSSYFLESELQKKKFYDSIYEIANTKMTAGERQEFLLLLASKLKVDIAWILENNCFKNISSKQCKELSERGVDIQLHTHRHTFPEDDLKKSKEEILENKAILEKLTNKTLSHFCYPSGFYSNSQFPLLEELGIQSSTTVESGLNDQHSHKFELTRFLDGQNITQIEFEAEISGFANFLRGFFK